MSDAAILEAVNSKTQADLVLVGRSEEGTSGGALYVAWPDGRQSAVTIFLGRAAHAQQTASLLELARSRGLLVPRHELIVDTDHGAFVVQERLAGSPPAAVTTAVMDAVVDINDGFAHLLRDRPDVEQLPLCLSQSGDPYPRHEVLAAHSSRSWNVLAAIRAIGAEGPIGLDGDDLLHIDLDLSNVLFDTDGAVTGVIDWNLGAYRGDRNLALVKTRFEQEWSLHEPRSDPVRAEAVRHLDAVLEERVSPRDLRRYWAHRLLYQLHWALQSMPPEVVDWHLDVAEERLQ